jgi:peptidoglycan/LPS O-acetylase OafA/YrhL
MLGDRLSGRDNALNTLRLVLAVLVVVSHSLTLGGFGPEPTWGGQTWGKWAVAGFFALSGYLIAGSRSRLALGPFLAHRALRIMPGFWACLVVVALLAAPLSVTLPGGDWTLSGAVAYVVTNAALHIHTWGVPHTLARVPYPTVWNGSLWTLAYEFAAYVMVGLMLVSQRVRRSPGAWFFAALVVVTAIHVIQRLEHVVSFAAVNGVMLAGFFLAGMILWAVRGRLRTTWAGFVAAAAVLVLTALTHTFTYAGGLPLGYVLLVAGARLPFRLGATNDVSYGMYIYAFPVQQLLAAAGLHWGGSLAFTLVTTVLVVPLATLSWFVIERPALRLARRWFGRPRTSTETD